MGAAASSLPCPEGVSESTRRELEALPAAAKAELPEGVSEAARNELEALPDAAKAELMSAAAKPKVFTPEATSAGTGTESRSGMTPLQALEAAV
jgi:hypothetical protein